MYRYAKKEFYLYVYYIRRLIDITIVTVYYYYHYYTQGSGLGNESSLLHYRLVCPPPLYMYTNTW